MDKKLLKNESENQQKGTLLSVTVHTLLVLLVYFMPTPTPVKQPEPPVITVDVPDGLGGAVALGLPDQGQGNNPPPGPPTPNTSPNFKPPVPTMAKPSAPAARPSNNAKPVVTANDAEAEEQRRVDAQNKAKAAAEAQAAANRQQRFGSRFGEPTAPSGGEGTGNGRGNTGRPGSQGVPDGDPSSRKLTGVNSPGSVSGFGNRRAVSAPKLSSNNQETGTVVVAVCINADGSVKNVRVKQAGTTTTSAVLLDLARKNANQFRFEAGQREDCGEITYRFLLR